MIKLKNSFLTDRFSHIYIESEALGYGLTYEIADRFLKAKRIIVENYKDVFNRVNQDFQSQKASQKLIIAVKKDNFIYKGPEICQNFGNTNFFYTSTVLNCIYNCDYCYLQGMYPSANIVAFVNYEDFYKKVDDELHKAPVYLTVSYDTDLLALENIIPAVSKWVKYASTRPNLQMEIRTKSVNYAPLSKFEPVNNVILAWTLSPDAVIKKYEKHTPSLKNRLIAIKKALNDGWNVRLCFDPLIYFTDWQGIYEDFFQKVFFELPGSLIKDVSIGTFRMSIEYMKRIRKSRQDSDLLYYPFYCANGIASYPPELEKKMLDHTFNIIKNHISEDKIFAYR